MDFEQLLKQRYTTKHYDNTRKVPDETITKILECVRLTPTSVNAQPYHFYVLTGAAKDSLRPAIMDFNLQRYDGASHAIVIACKTGIDEEMQLIYYLEGRHEHGEIFFSAFLGDCGVHLLRETSAL